eukprot:768033-Amphidinium_carterae.1
MLDEQDPEIESRMADEEPIFEDEHNRLETGRTEVEPVDMEVDDDSHRASTFAGTCRRRISPGVSSDHKPDEFVDCIAEIAAIDSSCIRDFGDETLS